MTVYEQLIEYCDCLIVSEPHEAPYAKFDERDVNELIDLISNYTCWANKPCETFLQSERKEVIDVKDCSCECDVIEFEPYYAPFDVDSFEFTLVEQNGIEETLTPITTYKYSEADEKFRLELPLPNCDCKPRCGCKSNYKLVIKYVAGYEELPECLLPLFCETLQWIIDKNKCDCEKCEECENKYTDKHEIDFTTVDGRLKNYFLNVMVSQYIRQLSLISLCKKNLDMWSVVV